MANGLFSGIIWASQEDVVSGVDSPIDGESINLNTTSEAQIAGYEVSADHSVLMKSGGVPTWANLIDYWQFDTTAGEGPAEGKVFWDAEAKTLAIGMPGGSAILQVGQEIYVRAKNGQGAIIPNGSVVYVSSATGSNPTVKLASASDYMQTLGAIAMATEDVGNNQFGYFTLLGTVHDVNTFGMTEGAFIYLSETPGVFTQTPPVYPAYRSVIGMVTRASATEGSISVRPQFIFRKFGDVINGNYTGFDDIGHQRMYLGARPWRDEKNDALILRVQGTGVSANATDSTMEFTTASNLSDYLYANVQLNHDRDETSAIYPHIHFFQAQNNVPNFLLQYRWQLNGGAKVTAWTNYKCNTPEASYTSGIIMQVAHGTGITPPVGSGLSDIIQFRILRDNANTSAVFAGADPYTATVGLLSFDIHIQLNSIGSTGEFTKG